jgi:CHASE2 domain-containing sensor protein
VLRSFVHTIRAKGWKHWAWAGALIVVGEFFSDSLADREPLLSIRYTAYQLFQNHGPREVKSRYTAVVPIDDAAFYHGGFTPSSPIDHALLAALISKVALHNPAVIVLDFDLSTGDEAVVTPVTLPNGTTVNLHEYKERAPKALKLASAIDDAASKRPFVLSEEIDEAGVADKWVRLRDVYEDYPFQNEKKIRKAHIRLDTDARKVPQAAELENGESVPSISITAAEAHNSSAAGAESSHAESFAAFLTVAKIPTVTASDLLKENPGGLDQAISATLDHRVVLIGGSWNVAGDRRKGQTVDTHNTPVGEMPGVYVHANYIESLLDSRLLKNSGTVVVEVFLAVLSALALAVPTTPWKRWAVIGAVVIVPIILCYGSVVLWGVYFDVLLVDILLLGHISVETVREWYRDHVAYRQLLANGIIQEQH